MRGVRVWLVVACLAAACGGGSRCGPTGRSAGLGERVGRGRRARRRNADGGHATEDRPMRGHPRWHRPARRDVLDAAPRLLALALLQVDAFEGPRQRSAGRLPDGGRHAARARHRRRPIRSRTSAISRPGTTSRTTAPASSRSGGRNTFAPRKDQPRDSGLLYHLRGDDKIWPQCIEFQIMEHNVGDLWVLSGTGVTAPVDDPSASEPTFEPLGQTRRRPERPGHQVVGGGEAHRLEHTSSSSPRGRTRRRSSTGSG